MARLLLSYLLIACTSICFSCLLEPVEMSGTPHITSPESCECHCHAAQPIQNQIQTMPIRSLDIKYIGLNPLPAFNPTYLTFVSFPGTNAIEKAPLSCQDPALPNVLRV
ncbi:MAG: hypothetical protein A2350_12555 [Candidatus Raymondbacteria bacterium RifOxyB12_full_50_8]|nr:MAG: hypothetical protein A2350_12555 [Candidatus Raymondbacteria bacterium RifOxyB12_full_50_8]